MHLHATCLEMISGQIILKPMGWFSFGLYPNSPRPNIFDVTQLLFYYSTLIFHQKQIVDQKTGPIFFYSTLIDPDPPKNIMILLFFLSSLFLRPCFTAVTCLATSRNHPTVSYLNIKVEYLLFLKVDLFVILLSCERYLIFFL